MSPRKSNNGSTGRISAKKLKSILQDPPPKIEKESDGETFLMDDEGNYVRKICGRWSIDLPDIVPYGVENPYDVVNPSREYVCTKNAGEDTMHPGMGPCSRHQEEVSQKGKKGRFNDALLQSMGDFDSYLDQAKARTTPSELLDITRPLYELEALKMMTIAYMREEGYSQSAIESIAAKIRDGAEVQLMLAKRDHEIIKNKAIATIIRMMVVGTLDIIDKVLKGDDRQKAKEIAKRMNDDLLLPAQKSGLTEILQRQESTGAVERVALLVEQGEEQEGQGSS